MVYNLIVVVSASTGLEVRPKASRGRSKGPTRGAVQKKRVLDLIEESTHKKVMASFRGDLPGTLGGGPIP